MKIRNYESGRSMIEMLGVLAIMGVITVSAVQMIGAAMRSQRRTTVQDEVAQMVTGVRQLLGDYDNYSGIDNETIFAAIGMTNKNPYGGTYKLMANTSNTQQFIVSITGLNHSDCEYFKTKAWPDSSIFKSSDGKLSGAAAIPDNCNDSTGKNTIQINYSD